MIMKNQPRWYQQTDAPCNRFWSQLPLHPSGYHLLGKVLEIDERPPSPRSESYPRTMIY